MRATLKTLEQRKSFKRARSICQTISQYAKLQHPVNKDGKTTNAGLNQKCTIFNIHFQKDETTFDFLLRSNVDIGYV